MQRIEVSPEMLAFVGVGRAERSGWPPRAVTLSFHLGTAPTLTGGVCDDADVILVVDPAACRRVFGRLVPEGRWHVPSELRAILLTLCDDAAPSPARDTLRLAKSLELLCATFERLDALVPVDSAGELSELDAARVIAARRLVDERWHEKLTLDAIARACGLNRAKLTRGFRLLFDCTVADLLAENRLKGARRMLLATDLPVSTVGYRCGYLNNASFTRAFSRRFGVAPSGLRLGAARPGAVAVAA